MDYATLKAFKPSEYEDAADGYRSMGNVAQAGKERVENTVAAGMRKPLQGEQRRRHRSSFKPWRRTSTTSRPNAA